MRYVRLMREETRLPSRIITATVVSVLFCATAALAAPPRMPQELIDFAHSKGCVPIEDFSGQPAMVNPSFVYGFASGGVKNSAALWCKRREPSDKPYLLLLKVNNPQLLEGCPARIEWWNPPRGLSVHTMTSIDLSQFRYVSDARRPGPTVTVPRRRVITSEYDGVQDTFLCYRGTWLVRMRD